MQSPPTRPGRWLRIAAIAAIALGCGDARRPNVLLVTIDTLRADHLSAYGYERETTPYLDTLATSGVRFDRAYASSSWTAPSVASLLTSLDPPVHGIEHGHLANQVIVQQEVIPDALTLWPELLRDAGYRTFGITANTHLYGRFGFAQGFDRYECIGFLTADDVLAVLERWRDDIVGGGPWFVWLHLLDPHARYTPRPPWIDEYFPDYQLAWWPIRRVLVPEEYKNHGVTAGSRSLELVTALYDAEIRYTDDAIRRASELLGVDEGDMVVVTADHGEEFLEHGRFGHGATLHEEVLRVPLLLKLPGKAHAGRTVSAPVGGIDVLPTVLDALGISAPVALQGRSALPYLEADPGEPHPVTASLNRFPILGQDAVIEGRWKFIRRRRSEQQQLFDLEADPHEQTNRIDDEPEVAARLAAVLTRSLLAASERRVEPGSAELSSDELEQLEALGYVPPR
jgi:arylsulfatase A-like enzyme